MVIDYSSLPAHMRESTRAYVEHGIPGGSFLTSVFSNELMQAFMRADHINEAAMRIWAQFLYRQAPSGCQGSPEKVKQWQEQGGLEGFYKECAKRFPKKEVENAKD